MRQLLYLRLCRLLELAALLLSLASLLGYLGRFHWFLDLSSHFRVQYSIGFTALCHCFLLRRKWKSSAALFALALLNAGAFLPYYVSQPPAAASEPSLRIMLSNVNSDTGDPQQVLAEVALQQPDVLIIQEVNRYWIRELSSLEETYPYLIKGPREDNFGLAVFSRFPLAEGRSLNLGSVIRPPVIQANVLSPQGPFNLVTAHPKPPIGGKRARSRNEQLEELPSLFPEDLPVLLIGDLNCSSWNVHFRRMQRAGGLRNSQEGFGTQPSWPVQLPSLFRIPIDHALYSEGILVHDRRLGNPCGSDHLPVLLEISLQRAVPAVSDV